VFIAAALLGSGALISLVLLTHRQLATQPAAEAPGPAAPSLPQPAQVPSLTPAPEPASPAKPGPPVIAQPTSPATAPLPSVPQFPWPPPTASASYVLPDNLFANRATVGDVTSAIIAALEHDGYVERSFFQTQPGGVALVTRLERINTDGSPAADSKRWPSISQNVAPPNVDLLSFLRGLFFVDPGHYRVIVFILQDLPFTQSSHMTTQEEAHAWLVSGANVLPSEIAARPFKGGHCTVLIYEFASDGTAVHLIESPLTGKQHLERSGLLSLLEKAD
jgi:hypothetical protein